MVNDRILPRLLVGFGEIVEHLVRWGPGLEGLRARRHVRCDGEEQGGVSAAGERDATRLTGQRVGEKLLERLAGGRVDADRWRERLSEASDQVATGNFRGRHRVQLVHDPGNVSAAP